MLKDSDIRLALHATEIRRICDESPDSRVVDELGLMEGSYRIDVAVVNGKLHGYEIKSAADNLDRLPTQQASYNKIFDKLTLVVDACHMESALNLVPQCWGLIVAQNVYGKAELNEIWPPRQNYAIDPYCLSQLLWRDEAWEILKQRKIGRGLWDKPRKVLWRTLAANVPIEDLKEIVRHTLKNRQGWR